MLPSDVIKLKINICIYLHVFCIYLHVMLYIAVYSTVIFLLTECTKVYAKFINYIIDCNKATAMWTEVYKDGVNDMSIKSW